MVKSSANAWGLVLSSSMALLEACSKRVDTILTDRGHRPRATITRVGKFRFQPFGDGEMVLSWSQQQNGDMPKKME